MMTRWLLCAALLLLCAESALAQSGGFLGGFADGLNSGRSYNLQRQQLSLQQHQLRLQQAPYLMKLREEEFTQEAKLWAGSVQQGRALIGQDPLSTEDLVARLEQLGAFAWELQYKQQLLK
jgi:hypothetical protein